MWVKFSMKYEGKLRRDRGLQVTVDQIRGTVTQNYTGLRLLNQIVDMVVQSRSHSWAKVVGKC